MWTAVHLFLPSTFTLLYCCIWSKFLTDHVLLDDVFMISSADLCLSVGVLRPFTFKVDAGTSGLESWCFMLLSQFLVHFHFLTSQCRLLIFRDSVSVCLECFLFLFIYFLECSLMCGFVWLLLLFGHHSVPTWTWSSLSAFHHFLENVSRPMWNVDPISFKGFFLPYFLNVIVVFSIFCTYVECHIWWLFKALLQ